MPWFVWLGIVGWCVCWLVAVVAQEPDDALDGAIVLFTCFFLWPLFALGWVVSRPFA